MKFLRRDVPRAITESTKKKTHRKTSLDRRLWKKGMTSGAVTTAQVGAFSMAVVLQGMSPAECADLTRAMIRSGRAMAAWPEEWPPACLVDKHSTGGVGTRYPSFWLGWVMGEGSVKFLRRDVARAITESTRKWKTSLVVASEKRA